jgi:hypothetical protein
MGTEKSPDPIDRMGVYKHLSAVPETDRFKQFTETYTDRDVWAEFVAAQSNEFDSKHYHQTFEKTERTWKAHIASEGRHHALATPHDIETYCRTLAETRKLKTVYSQYWVRLEEFYSWLQWHTDHPHTYHPVLMAAANHETASEIWAVKMGRWDGADE